MPKEHGETGEFVETVSLADVLDTFDAVEGPVILSADVADRLDCSRETARQKLAQLYDRGDVDRRKVSRRVLYWRAADADQSSANSDAVEGEIQGSIETSLDDDLPSDHGDEGTVEGADEIAAAIARVDTPGSGESRERREQALRDAYEYLRAEGQAQRSDFGDLLGDDVGYNGGFNSWWKNYGTDALKQLPNVDPPGEGEHTWYYTGDGAGSGIYDPTEEF